MSTTKKSNIFYTKQACPMVVQEGELLMNMSYDSADGQDDDGNPIKIYFWINGTWSLHYKGREFLIPLSENISALVDWINAGGPELVDTVSNES